MQKSSVNKVIIVGHIGNFPMQYYLNKKPYFCLALYGWIVDKQYRSQSIMLLKKCLIT